MYTTLYLDIQPPCRYSICPQYPLCTHTEEPVARRECAALTGVDREMIPSERRLDLPPCDSKPVLQLTMTDYNLTLAVPRLSSSPQHEVSSVLVSHPGPAQLPLNHVLIRVDRFGFTANNVSYQALGEIPHFR